MLFNIEALQLIAEPERIVAKKKSKKRKSSKATGLPQSQALEADKQVLEEQPSTPPAAAWPPRCLSGAGPPCARKPSASSLQSPNPNYPGFHSGRTMPARPVSAPLNGRAAAPGAPAAASATTHDADTSQPVNWSVDAPLPSIRTVKGREQFLQTPAFVIAAHYERGETLRAKAHRDDLGEKLKQAARFQKAVVKEKMDLEETLSRTTSELEWYKSEHKQMKVKCQQMSEQLLVLQRSARDAKAAHSVMSQAKQAAQGSTQQLQQELGQAQSEIARLRAQLAAAGIKNP